MIEIETKSKTLSKERKIFMKKIIIMIAITLITIHLYGCSKAEIERSPVIIDHASNQEDPSINTPINTDETDSKEDVPSNTDESQSSGDQQTKDNTLDQKNNDLNSEEKEDEIIPTIIELEGMNEIINTKLIRSSLGYSIQYDIDRLSHMFENNVDSFIAPNPNPDLYPYVYLNIKRIENVTIKDYSDQWLKTITSEKKYKFEEITNTSINGYNTLHYNLVTGKEWNSTVRNYYMVEGNQSVYFIETQYFLEAEEGYGARLTAMLKTFQIK